MFWSMPNYSELFHQMSEIILNFKPRCRIWSTLNDLDPPKIYTEDWSKYGWGADPPQPKIFEKSSGFGGLDWVNKPSPFFGVTLQWFQPFWIWTISNHQDQTCRIHPNILTDQLSQVCLASETRGQSMMVWNSSE